jgi:predicted metal-dependent HD superfamily phosphohydrolase/dephospho-CoA kinase
MIKLIVTGSIGSGKSTFVSLLQKSLDGVADIDFVDMDSIVADMFTREDVLADLTDTFGIRYKEEVIARLSSGDTKFQEEYNNFIERYTSEYLISMALSNNNIILEYPLFFEAYLKSPSAATQILRKHFTVINVTMDNKDERIARVKERCKIKHPNWTDEFIDVLISAQASEVLKNGLADLVIENRGSLEELQEDVDGFIDEWIDECAGEFVPALEMMAGLGMDGRINRDVFRIAQHAYSEPHRHYHDNSHIVGMFQSLAYSEASDLLAYEPMQLAILFHDFTYNPTAIGNEERSIEIMKQVLETFSPEIHRDRQYNIAAAELMILATITHNIPNNEEFTKLLESYPEVIDALKVFLDLDLLIFAEPYDSVNHGYDEKIRLEYSMYPAEEFNKGRLEVLKKFYNRDKIFISSVFGTKKNEKRAKDNLKKLIEKYEGLVNG